MTTCSVLLLNQPLFVYSFLLQCLKDGVFIKLVSRMHFCMVLMMKIGVKLTQKLRMSRIHKTMWLLQCLYKHGMPDPALGVRQS